jgi:DNA modification methylase
MSAPYYSDDYVTLYHGRCEDILPAVSGVDLFVTSPPYNLGVTTGGGFGHWKEGQKKGGQEKWGGTGRDGIDYADHNDAMPYEEYEAWQKDCLRLMWGALSERGAIYYNHKPRVQARTLWTPLNLNPGLPVRQIVMWTRAGGMNFAPTHYVPTHEWLVILAKPDFRLTSRGASGVGDVWHIPQKPDPDHPAPFPLGLPARAIETTAPALVGDPFAGTGTTLRAAKDAGVRAVGIEKSERYCEVAAKRLEADVLPFETEASA